uniref:Uncharacterized protein n=1 Tax=Mycena chlorophos TaxID=658473 RepID=A0ABQ0LC26_MYCCL|nr:predicted protein [Mycena chlorophos]
MKQRLAVEASHQPPYLYMPTETSEDGPIHAGNEFFHGAHHLALSNATFTSIMINHIRVDETMSGFYKIPLGDINLRHEST